MNLSVVIPTYGRDEVLLETIEKVMELEPPPGELLVVDQTLRHGGLAETRLAALADAGRIDWIRLARPSVPHAMNVGLLRAREEIVLFLDDDVVPGERLIPAHLQAHRSNRTVVAGQVLQPGEEPESDSDPLKFSSARSGWIDGVMAGNVSIRREVALRVGGFDENFVRVAYRFETEFADRLRRAGERIWFEPAASVRHLKIERGGTRSYGDHRRTLRPGHAVGAFYYLLRKKPAKARPVRVLDRLRQSIWTRYHLTHPWWIPGTLFAESVGLAWAGALAIRGPRLLDGNERRPLRTKSA